MREFILAIDPGVTTGYALASVGDGNALIAYGQETMTHHQCLLWLTEMHPDRMICEAFNYQPNHDKVNLYACEIIGIVHLYAEMADKKVYMQQPSIQGDKTAYWSDDKLREADLYVPGERVHHGRQAMKHLMHWFTFGAGAEYKAEFGLVQLEWLLTSIGPPPPPPPPVVKQPAVEEKSR